MDGEAADLGGALAAEASCSNDFGVGGLTVEAAVSVDAEREGAQSGTVRVGRAEGEACGAKPVERCRGGFVTAPGVALLEQLGGALFVMLPCRTLIEKR